MIDLSQLAGPNSSANIKVLVHITGAVFLWRFPEYVEAFSQAQSD